MFFVDEIHRLPRALEETFYPAMEDRRLPITVGQGAGARVVTLDLPGFTMIGATTRTGLLTTPLRDRFGVTHRLELYEPADLARDRARARPGSSRSRSTRRAPRRSPRGRAAPRGWPTGCSSARATSPRSAAPGASMPPSRARRSTCSRWTTAGLDRLDREILTAICAKFGGGPVGLSTLAVAVGEEADTIEDVYEPYLLQQGFIMRTPRGRVATDAAFAHLGVERPTAAGAALLDARAALRTP